MHIADNIARIRKSLPDGIELINVSKFQPKEALLKAYDFGERHFGESRVQELLDKHRNLPIDIHWHFIGHLQTNKVRSIVPFIALIQSVDSLHLLQVIQKEAALVNRCVHVLLEVHVAEEDTKTGFSLTEIRELFAMGVERWPNVKIDGLMAMASNTDNEERIRADFRSLKALFDDMRQVVPMTILSMGMTEDYHIAIEEGSTMVRIGTAIFGDR